MKKSIFIASPMYGGNCSGIFTESFIIAYKKLQDLGYNVNYGFLYNESLITRARNTLTEMFLRSNFNYLLFIDSDQMFDYLDIDRMIKEDKAILGAAVPMKTINWNAVKLAAKKGYQNLEDYTPSFNINFKNGVNIKDLEKPFEVDYIGTGMMLIKKEVFLKLKNKLPTYRNKSGELKGIKNDDLITEFFTTSIDEKNNLLSEDYNFCKIAKDNGYKIYGVAYPKVKHAGTYFF